MNDVIIILGSAIAANCFWVYVIAPFLDKRPARAFFVNPRRLPGKQENKEGNTDSLAKNMTC